MKRMKIWRKICGAALAASLVLCSTAMAFAGGFTPEEQIQGAVKAAADATKKDGNAIYAEVPVLMFHHIDDKEGSPLRPDSFETYMKDLAEAGYETVFLDDLISFVDGEGTLPEKPVVITFDDGYESNYVYAYPLLKEMGMKADISIIGETVGCSIYPGTNMAMTPHFTWEQAKEMYDSGVIRIHSHTYKLHQHKSVVTVERSGVLKNPGEPFADYITMFRGDTTTLNRMIEDKVHYSNKVYTYPYGLNDALTESLLEDMEFRVTLTIDPGVNILEAGNPDSLRLLNRISCDKNDLNIVKLIEEQRRIQSLTGNEERLVD